MKLGTAAVSGIDNAKLFLSAIVQGAASGAAGCRNTVCLVNTDVRGGGAVAVVTQSAELTVRGGCARVVAG